MTMPSFSRLAPLAAVCVLAAPVVGQPDVQPAAPPVAQIAPILPDSPAWLEARGVLSVDETLALLGTQATPEQRARLERASSERNEALRQADARFAAVLRETLAVSTQDLEERKSDADRDAEMERIRRFQPLRYQALKRGYDKEKREREQRARERQQQAQNAPATAIPAEPPGKSD